MIKEIQKLGIERGYNFACKVSVAKIDPTISYSTNFRTNTVPDIETAEICFKLKAAENEETDRNYSHFIKIEDMLDKSQKHVDFDVWAIFNQSVEEGVNIKWEELC